MPINKRYQVQVFEPDGTTYIDTFNPNEIRSEIKFKNQINYGQGQLSFIVNRKFDNFGEGSEINMHNIVEVYEIDENNSDPRRIFSGFISQYHPFVGQGDQGVTVICLGVLSLLTYVPYRSEGNFEFNKNDSPEDIIQEIIDEFDVYYPGIITTDLAVTGQNSDIDFSKVDSFKAIQNIFTTIGSNFYFYIDENRVLNLKPKPTSATHTFTIGKDIDFIKTQKSSEEIINRVTLFYSGGTEIAIDTDSIAANGRHERVFTNTEIKDSATAINFVNQTIAENKDRKIKANMRINSEYDIETIKPGDTCEIANILETQTTFTNNMQIVSVTYSPNFVILELEDFNVKFGIQLERFIS